MSSRYVIMASMGFSADFVLRRVTDVQSLRRVDYVVAVGLDAGDGLWSRVEQTFSILRHYLTGVGIGSELRRIRLSPRIIREARDEIVYGVSLSGDDGSLELFLTGGPRMLIVSLMVAAYMLDERLIDRVRIVSYGEGFPGSVNIGLRQLRALSLLDEKSRRILESIRSGVSDVKRLTEIVGLPRSTLYLKLDELRALGLIYNSRGKWFIQEDVENLV